MHGQNDQQAYDRGTNIFSPDGRLYQVEYAREAVKRGSASVGVRTPEGVALAAERRTRSRLIEPESVEKLHKVTDHIGIASAGHVADARQLIDVARRQAQMNQLRYGERLDVEDLTKAITDHVQEYTQVGGARPFGVSLLFGGVDQDGTPQLYEADPSGTPYAWKAVAIGGNRDEIQTRLEEGYEPGLGLESGVNLALEALAAPADEDEFNGDDFSVGVIDAETEAYTRFTADDINDQLEEIGLAAGDSE